MILIEKNFLSLSAAFPYDSLRSKEITDINIINEYFVRINFHTALGFVTIIKKYLCFFISLQICHHNDIATVTTFSFSRTGGN